MKRQRPTYLDEYIAVANLLARKARGFDLAPEERQRVVDFIGPDPKPPTLRDEALRELLRRGGDRREAADGITAALAVVRRRIEALPSFVPDNCVVLEALVRDDVLALFDGGAQ